MRLFYWQWHSFMNQGVERGMTALSLDYDTFFYQPADWEADEAFIRKCRTALEKRAYDAAFSVNFNPMLSTLCHELGIPYLSWVYDSPIHIRDLAPMKNENNRIFFFDRGQAQEYREVGYPAEYLPLAGDTVSFQKVIRGASVKERERYATQIAFVGQLYQTDYDYYMGPLHPYQRGYLEGVLNAQSKVYGGYLIPPFLTGELLSELNARYQEASGGSVQIDARELEFLLAQEVTARERFLALSLLQSHAKTELYTVQRDERLSGVIQHEYVDYYTKMPLVFANAKINLNISLRCIRTGIPLRVFDVLSCGGFLITNFQTELAEYFELGQDLVCYQSPEELTALCDYYLRRDTERELIAQNGRRRVEAEFTFEKQMKKIFEKI